MIQFTSKRGQFTAALSKIQRAREGVGEALYRATFDSLLLVRTTAVKPGYAPFRTGTLRRSITHRVDRKAQRIEGAVGSNLVYARIQEFGGKAGRGGSVNIQGKLYLTRAIEENKAAIQDTFRRYLAIKKHTK